MSTQETITKLYVATFNRAADSDGLSYWDGSGLIHTSLTSISDIAISMTQSTEYQTLYANFSREETVSKMYENILDREADAEELAYWSTGDVPINLMSLALINGAESATGSSTDALTLQNKTNVGLAFANAGLNDAELAKSIMDLVTNDSTSVTTAQNMIDENKELHTGVVSDGYISGATIFADSNGDGIWNDGEARAITDASGNYTLAGGSGSIIASGGTDISTGIAFEGIFSAPAGSTTISPLTTLIDQIMRSTPEGEIPPSPEEATAQVAMALGIDESVNLLTFDPIAAASDTTLSEEAQAAAAATQAAAVQVVNMMSQSAALLNGAGVASEADGALAAASSLAAMISDAVAATQAAVDAGEEPVSAVIDLGSASVVESFLQASAVQAGATLEQVAAVEAVSESIATATANINTVMADAVANAEEGASIADIFTQLAQTQVAAEAIEDLAASAAASGDTDAVTAASDTNAIESASEEAADEVAAAEEIADEAIAAEEATQESQIVLYFNPNYSPTVESSLLSNTTEGADFYTIDLLQGASDIDVDSILNITQISELNNEDGWSVNNNTLTITPSYYGELSSNEIKTLNFAYYIQDQFGAKVSQTLDVNIQGSDAPILDVVVSAADLANKIDITVDTQPDVDERVEISFENIPNGATLSNASIGLDGKKLYTLTLDDVNTDTNISVIATGYDDSNQIIASTSQNVALSYETSSSTKSLTFNSDNQNIWSGGSDTVLVDYHQYIPVLGGISKVWNSNLNQWDIVNDAAVWDSGLVHVLNTNINSQKITDEIANASNKLLADAQAVFDVASVAVDNAALSTFDAAQAVFDNDTADVIISKSVTDAFNAARNTYDAASNVYSAADRAFNTTATNTYNGFHNIRTSAYSTYKDARSDYYDAKQAWKDSAHTVWGVTYHSPTKSAAKLAAYLEKKATWALYEVAKSADIAAKSVYEDARDILDLAKTVWDSAKTAWDSANSTYEQAVRDAAEDAQKAVVDTFKDAQAAYQTVKDGIFNAAQSALDGVKSANTATMTALDKLDFENKLKLDTQLKANVGFQVDFELNSGTVDTDLNYTLTSLNQYNNTTDTLTITPTMLNTTGDNIAFTTVSPDSKFIVKLISNIQADVDMYLDGHLIVDKTILYDLSPNGDPIHVDKTLSTSSYKATYEGLSQEDKDEIGSDGSELTIVNYNSKNTDLTSEDALNLLLRFTTKGAISVDLNNQNIATNGTQATYNQSYFQEGGLVNINFSEITDIISDIVTQKVDYSDEIKELYDLESLDNKTFHDIISDSSAVVSGILMDNLDGKSDAVPIYILDTTDETTNSLFHINAVEDDLSTLNENTADFGFYTSYGESEPIVKTIVDIDRLAAVVINYIVKAAAVSSGIGAAVADKIPVINPFDLSLDLGNILKTVHLDGNDITKYLNFAIAIEAADIDVSGEVGFSQEFSLSVDDMSYLITLEDGTTQQFNANENDNITIQNISSHDTNHDGNIEYSINIVPTAMFSNDTEIGHSLAYSIEFLQNSLSTGFEIPIEDLLGNILDSNIVTLLPDIDISLLDMNFGPLFTFKGDLDTLDIDVFENRFALDIGLASSDVQIVGITDDTMFLA